MKKLIYLDHGASTHAPQVVLDEYINVHSQYYANVHRGEHELSCQSSEQLDHVPYQIADFFGIKNYENSGLQSVLTYNTTSSLDLASHVFSKVTGDVITTEMEHHSNDLPHRSRGTVHHTKVLEDGKLNLDMMEDLLQKNNIKLVAVSAASNVTGHTPPVAKIAKMAHDNGAKILVDAAQRLAHKKIEIKPIDHSEHIDFIAAAGHKFYSPFGSAFLMGSIENFDAADPYIPGGGTVKFVGLENVLFDNGPERHSYGTPNIAGAIAMGKSLDFLREIGIDKIEQHERELLTHLEKGLRQIDGVNVLGNIPLDEKIGVVSFNVNGYYHSEVAKILNNEAAIATRNGCFCAHPYLMNLLGVKMEDSMHYFDDLKAGKDVKLPGAVRATIGIYNTIEEMDELLRVVDDISNKQLIKN